MALPRARAVLVPGAQAYGVIDNSGTDEDWYRITLSATSDLRIWTGPGFTAPIDDTVVSLRDASGGEIVRIDDGSDLIDWYSILTVPSVAAGTYYLVVSGYDTTTIGAYTLDVAAIPVLKRESHLPVIVDPSHAGGIASLVAPLAFAAVAAGADGLIVEVHPDPECALSDGEQSLPPSEFATMMQQLEAFAAAAGRTLVHQSGNLAVA